MKRKYLLPRLKVLEINGSDMLCESYQSNKATVNSMNIGLDDYSTYSEPIQPRSGNSVDWSNAGTGSDF